MILMGVELTILIYDSYSLKDKRSTVKSVVHRIRNRHHLTTAEVDEWDLHNKAVLGFGVVGSNRQLCRQQIEAALKDVEEHYEIEILHVEWIEA
ncbi:hypothetical protein IRB23SM22_16930 [Alkalibacterium sp. s-m-22]|uniref:DUF503 domain-containing protein n=2 Tax=Alkalibacterium TaxID=99906 RepID=A0A1G9CHI7_9LACT|nr:DUF503 domain-containing protein [Alkalibacterium thalassium]SDK50885.1 hypothetical protein SAMN04488098_10358 [Alkalibacterium thalassium]